MSSIALFGGSFDPPHVGHEAIVEEALKIKDISKVIIMPTYLNPFKSNYYAPAPLRVAWLKEIFKKSLHVEVSTFEVDLKRKVSTIESVKYLLNSYNKIYLIIGADNLKSLHKWNNYKELTKLVTFIIASRDSIDISANYIELKVEKDISSTLLRDSTCSDYLSPICSNEIVKFYKDKKLKTRIENIVKVLDDNKADSIEVFDLSERNYFVDYAIIASSLGIKHTIALLDHMKNGLKPQEHFNQVDESGDWIVVDLGDILVHIMTPEYRAIYKMEEFLGDLSKGKEGSV